MSLARVSRCPGWTCFAAGPALTCDYAGPLVVAGGGLRMGQVIGESDRQGSYPTTQTYTPANLLATVMHWLFDIPEFRLRTDLPSGIKDIVENGVPIRELVG